MTMGMSDLELMEQCLRHGHIAPTVPDTLDGFPFQGRDPLVIEEIPHVFFAGNRPEVCDATVNFEDGQRTKLMTIPSFAHTKTAVLLNLRTLELHEQTFDSLT